MKIVIATIKSWNIKEAYKFRNLYQDIYEIKIISEREELSYKTLSEYSPDFVFFPHWSEIIPAEIYEQFNCIVFHMTDLPFGRGGSPLQNLIIREVENTKISAIRVSKIIDAGPIYMKEDLNLNGSAEEIFIRAAKVIFNKMIPEILINNISTVNQSGEVVAFARRKPSQSELHSDMTMRQVYDYIRMLDAEGYPPAFIRFGNYKINFSRASLKSDRIIADVSIVQEDNNE
jgi:methionyl-tRNA formyltransferase